MDESLVLLVSLWPCLSGALIMPITDWLKKKLPADLPIGSTLISVVLSIVAVYLLAWLFDLGMDLKAIVVWVLGTDRIASLIHSAKKTFVKNSIP